MNRELKQKAIHSIFSSIVWDGQWHELTSPFSGYKNSYRVDSYKFGEQRMYLLDVKTKNGSNPAHRIGLVIVNPFGVTYRPITHKKYLHEYMGVASEQSIV